MVYFFFSIRKKTQVTMETNSWQVYSTRSIVRTTPEITGGALIDTRTNSVGVGRLLATQARVCASLAAAIARHLTTLPTPPQHIALSRRPSLAQPNHSRSSLKVEIHTRYKHHASPAITTERDCAICSHGVRRSKR